MMKKILCITASAATLFSLAACTSTAASTQAAASAPATENSTVSTAPAAPSPSSEAPSKTPEKSDDKASGATLNITGEWYDMDDAGESIVFYADGKFEMYDQEKNTRVKTDEGTYTISGSELALEGTELEKNKQEKFIGTGSIDSKNVLTLSILDDDDKTPDTDKFISLGDVKVADSIDKAALSSAAWKSGNIELNFSSNSKNCTLKVDGETKNCTYDIEGGFIEVEWEEAADHKDDDHEFAMSSDGSTLYALSLNGEALTQK